MITLIACEPGPKLNTSWASCHLMPQSSGIRGSQRHRDIKDFVQSHLGQDTEGTGAQALNLLGSSTSTRLGRQDRNSNRSEKSRPGLGSARPWVPLPVLTPERPAGRVTERVRLCPGPDVLLLLQVQRDAALLGSGPCGTTHLWSTSRRSRAAGGSSAWGPLRATACSLREPGP